MGRALQLALVIFWSLMMSGCLVSEGRYLQKVSEADALLQDQQALQKRYERLDLEHRELKASTEKLNLNLATLKGEKSRLEEVSAKLAVERNELVQDLKSSQNESLQRISELRQKIEGLEMDRERLRQQSEEVKQDLIRVQKAREEAVLVTSKTYEQLLDKMKSEISKGQVTISELQGKLTVNMVDSILFDSGKAEVKEYGLGVLFKVVDIIKGLGDKAIRIEGHTDNVPIRGLLAAKYPTNWELSAARAINVARYLQEQGINPLMLSAVAYGEFKPVAPNDSDEGRARNRRIEIILVPKE